MKDVGDLKPEEGAPVLLLLLLLLLLLHGSR
jgi:hypothetical protein